MRGFLVERARQAGRKKGDFASLKKILLHIIEPRRALKGISSRRVRIVRRPRRVLEKAMDGAS
jgi:hypothetical protein